MITVPEEAERFRIQAAKDWETLLLARAKEMASGKQKNTDPVLTSLDIFKNRDFFLRSTFRPYVNGVFGPKTWVLERSPEWSFCKRRFIVFVWTDVKEGF